MTAEIEPKENGPYIVRNLKSLKDANGDEINPGKDVVALCRCGKSGNKPFCDGTHVKAGFSSDTDAVDMGEWREYAGSGITIHDNRRLCAHAGECTEGLASVWRMGEKPWIDPEGADAAAIIEVIEKCPSGALSYSIGDDNPGEAGTDESVQVSANGPYHVKGGVTLNDPSRDTGRIPGQYALCRCGASKNKPFCDGSHWEIKFSDDGA